jgi:hypothetical protein
MNETLSIMDERIMDLNIPRHSVEQVRNWDHVEISYGTWGWSLRRSTVTSSSSRRSPGKSFWRWIKHSSSWRNLILVSWEDASKRGKIERVQAAPKVLCYWLPVYSFQGKIPHLKPCS